MVANRILAVVESSLRQQLLTEGRPCEFHHGDVLSRFGDPIDEVLFPFSGVVAFGACLKDGDAIASALVGSNGVLGGEIAFGGRSHSSQATTQLHGVGVIVPSKVVVEVSNRSERLRGMLFSHQQYMVAQAQQSAACNARHNLDQRLASWLLRISDACKSDVMFLTQDYLASLVGTTRPSVSGAASALAADDAIETRRGNISILNRKLLRQKACECHGRIVKLGAALMPCEPTQLLQSNVGKAAEE